MLSKLGLPIPYRTLNDHTMPQITWDARKKFELIKESGHDLNTTERSRYQSAVALNKAATEDQKRIEQIKCDLNNEAEIYLAKVDSGTVPFGFLQALLILRRWPCVTTSYDAMNIPTLLTSGAIPSLYPITSRRRVQSTFGITIGRTGGHAVLSEESKRYVDFARLFGRWTTTFSHEWFGDKVAFTIATILRTQDACFNTTDDTDGIIMVIDTASKPTGGYYVIDKWENNAMSFRTATNGSVVFKTQLVTTGLR